MAYEFIVVGDKTDHGGTVISGSPSQDIRGQAIARLGDAVNCPQSYPGGLPHGVNKIVTGHPTIKIEGKAVAIHGSLTECGCRLIGSTTVLGK
ncbi:PAAR domain-containing protein [Massilia sp. TWP1-3-3]|uniref:PAAR domain-containing protein n=1 Tax=Massilia sp. TWP1-3-3 TaxID=2804573 RepID=UPI003CFB8568